PAQTRDQAREPYDWALTVELVPALCADLASFRLRSIYHMACEGGYFNAIMSFPANYPNSPPSVRFTSEMWHPNVYPDGRVCISILHAPGEDPNGYELASERWTPVHTVESIVLSIISMLSSPNDESPANVEAAVKRVERAEGRLQEKGQPHRQTFSGNALRGGRRWERAEFEDMGGAGKDGPVNRSKLLLFHLKLYFYGQGHVVGNFFAS
ncbi:hypothetical protein Taro_015957, partial [Colocasia esculenta]|nr:hypothetical protein [Colocasia esculenta]